MPRAPAGRTSNKVPSALHLRFDVRASSLPEFYKKRLLALRDSRITADGVVIIKAQQYRTQEQIAWMPRASGRADTHRWQGVVVNPSRTVG